MGLSVNSLMIVPERKEKICVVDDQPGTIYLLRELTPKPAFATVYMICKLPGLHKDTQCTSTQSFTYTCNSATGVFIHYALIALVAVVIFR
jgi:hypothetical protein